MFIKCENVSLSNFLVFFFPFQILLGSCLLEHRGYWLCGAGDNVTWWGKARKEFILPFKVMLKWGCNRVFRQIKKPFQQAILEGCSSGKEKFTKAMYLMCSYMTAFI